MSELTPPFVSWEEKIICPERGRRVVHFYLKDSSGESVLSVIGIERSIRHMMYIVPDEFLRTYGIDILINGCTKWRARREVVEWLTSLVSQHNPPLGCLNLQIDDSLQALGSLRLSVTGFSSCQTNLPDQMPPRKFRVQNSDIVWSGLAWTCAKQLEHYPAFCRNGSTIEVHSFVFIMAEEGSHYLGYLEDLYEDKKGQKKVKVRWFHHNQEVKGVNFQPNPHPREVFITPHVQVISVECIDGSATVLTPKHYEKCLAIISHTLASGVFMCFRQLKNNKVKSFTLNKLRGYSNQPILSYLNGPRKVKCRKLNEQEGQEFYQEDSMGHDAKRKRSCKEHQSLVTSGVTDSTLQNQITKFESTYPKLRIKLSKRPIGIVGSQPQVSLSLKDDEKIELLCQDSGIRGCWFRCKVLQTSHKNVKVQYDDLQDVNGIGNLEEWVPASRVVAPDRLGMRCPGRTTIRPCPPEDSGCFSLVVGVPVDAWWSDGWWEGVVTGVDIAGNDSLQVYFPGENMFLSFQKKDLRSSRDWVENSWVDIKAKPDILSCIPSKVGASMKIPMCCTMLEASKSGGFAHLDHKVPSPSKLEVVEAEDKQELCSLVTFDSLTDNVDGDIMRKGPLTDATDEENNCAGVDDNCNAGNTKKFRGNFETANQKFESAGTTKVVA